MDKNNEVKEVVNSNYLGQTIEDTLANPKGDNSIKRIFRDKQVLAHLIRDISPEFKNVSYEELAAKYIDNEVSSPVQPHVETIREGTESISPGEAKINFDVRFRVSLPEQTEKQYRIHFDIEGQGSLYPGYDIKKRMLYYLSRMLSEQIPSLSKREYYDLLQPVTSIWIFYGPDVPVSKKGSIQTLELRNVEELCFGKVLFSESELNFERLVAIAVPDEETGNHTLDVLQNLLSVSKDKEARIDGLEKLGLVVSDKFKEEVENMDGLIQGIAGIIEAQGEAKGEDKSLARIAELVRRMVSAGRSEEALEAMCNPDRAKELFREYNI